MFERHLNDSQMDIKELEKQLQAKQQQVERLMRREMPVVAGNIAIRHYKENFRRSGFVNGGLQPWSITKRQQSGGKSAMSNKGPLLQSGRLMRGVRNSVSDYRVKILNDVPYAATHNWGGTVQPRVTPKMRGYAWFMYYKLTGRPPSAKGAAKSSKKGHKIKETAEAKMWKSLALTKKRNLRIHIPQRQFIGQSRELDTALQAELEKRLEAILK